MPEQIQFDKRDILRGSLEYFHQYNPGTALWRGIEATCFAEIDLVPPVLDVGCGDGAFGALTMYLSRKEAGSKDSKIDMGIDVHSEKFINTWAYKYFLRADAIELPFPNGYFNTVISNCVLEHIQDVISALTEINRVLKDGGRFYITVPSVYFNQYFLITSLLSKIGMNAVANRIVKMRNKKLSHHHTLTIGEWQAILTKGSFELVSHKYIISKIMQRIVFLIFDIYNIGIGRFTIGNVMRKLDLVCFSYFNKRLLSLFFHRILGGSFQKELNCSLNEGAGIFISARKALYSK
ncbi:MAG: class I SAM-dependent methyltransferase [Deltaproteobacteria bacterium]|nr:class I SAM-dependent methyltransferase [Deltaproteobacteria bacterium]